ncbi:MAG: NAD-dependent epimerase/dehydratase family protein [Myxococcota bacterium]|nr:NAD-dependent epimerase/dehydratase family protein [Myxococcota bacterium]MDW8361969.1 NAD-dependent epimerase/dehydratase family protein [Myxococcales bacterium]
MRVLVTGGAGFIGSHVVDAVLEQGAECIVVDDLSSGRREWVPAAARFVRADVCDAERIRRLFDEVRPDVVCHQAAQVSVSVSTREPLRDAQVNVLGTVALLEAAVRAGVRRFVFASTGGAIYGEVPEGQRADLDAIPRPRSPYACAKLSAEHYLGCFAHLHALETCALRYANVYGPRQDPHGEAGVVAIFTRRLLSGQPLTVFGRRRAGDGGCIRDYVYVADVVRANVQAIFGPSPPPVRNVATGIGTTTLELAHRLAVIVGVRPHIEDAPPRPGDLERSVLLPSSEEPTVSLDEGLARTVDWFRAHRDG